jgi:L-fucose isomerase-like protein
MYHDKMTDTAKKLGARLALRSEPLYSLAEAQSWIAEAETENVDGLVLVMLDRQEHSWPSAEKVAQSDIQSIIYSPLGTSFTTNTINLAETPGCVIYSTDDFSQAAYGMKMLYAAARMRRTRCVVIRGSKRSETTLADTGITMRVVPATTFIEQYNRTADSEDILAMADDYIRRARRVTGATRQDVINGVKSYYVAGKILENEQADAITMDCLGALGKIKVSLPCIAWSRMNDDGIPAACEADYGAVASHIITQYLFDRPGFQQDPVADTADDSIIGAHCSCPTKLNGFSSGPEPFDLMHHHGNRDAVPRTLWRKGRRVTSIDLLPGSEGQNRKTKILISAGTVLENMDVPPSGGCVVSVKVKFDGNQEVLSFPGFHQIFFYGDYKDQMKDFCRLCNFDAQVV